jgi:mRNA interferase RelE/StbE
MYEVYLERAAERGLRRISADIFGRIITQIRALSENPRPQGCRKIIGSKSDWRIRITDYRVIYEIDDKKNIVRVMRVRHRREVYR